MRAKRLGRAVLIIVSLALLGCTGCTSLPPTLQTGGRTYVDALGRRVELPRRPRRIVSLAPGMTEMLYALGAGERVVGVTNFCDYPAEVAGVKKVGGYTDPSLETICALKPDLVLAMHGISKSLVTRMEGLGLTVVTMNPAGLEELYLTLDDLGSMTGNTRQAADLVKELRRRQAAATIPPGSSGPTVFYVIWNEPLFTAGKKTLINDIIGVAGGRNVVEEAGFPQFSREKLLQIDPDVIIYSDRMSLGRRFKSDPFWSRLTAVKKGRTYAVNEDLVSRPGPRLLDGLETVSDVLRRARDAEEK